MKTIKIIKLNIEVEAKLRPEVLKKDLIIPKGWRLLTFSEFAYIAENKLLPLGDELRQWGTLNSSITCLDSDSDFSSWLDVSDDWSNYNGCAFGVRFCREMKK